MFQMGGIGPMMGQANVFFRYAPEKIPLRHRALPARVAGASSRSWTGGWPSEYLAGDYSIADIANCSWVRGYSWVGASVEGLPQVQRWLAAIDARPAVARGLAVPKPRALSEEQVAAERVAGAQKILV